MPRNQIESINYKLKKFNMDSIRDCSKSVFIGKPNCGKSTLVKDLLYHKRHVPSATVICPTHRSNGAYTGLVPESCIFDEYDSTITEDIIRRQRRVIKAKQEIPDTFYILDDCLYDDSWVKDTNMKYIFMNGRWEKIFFIWTMQYCLGIPPALRTCIDYVFILRENIIGNRRRLYEYYAGMFPSFDIFCSILDNCSENYECLVIDNTTISNKIEDQVFWYKADLHEDFRIGSDAFWRHCTMNYNPNHEDESQQKKSINSSTYRNRTSRGKTVTLEKTL